MAGIEPSGHSDYANINSFTTMHVMQTMVRNIAREEYMVDYTPHILASVADIIRIAQHHFFNKTVAPYANTCYDDHGVKQQLLDHYFTTSHDAITESQFSKIHPNIERLISLSVRAAVDTFVKTEVESLYRKNTQGPQPYLDGDTALAMYTRSYHATCREFDSIYAYDPTCTISGRNCGQKPPEARDLQSIYIIMHPSKIESIKTNVKVCTDIMTLIQKLVAHIVRDGNRWYIPACDIQNKSSFDVQNHLKPTGFTAWVLREANARCIPFCVSVGRAYNAAPPSKNELLVPGVCVNAAAPKNNERKIFTDSVNVIGSNMNVSTVHTHSFHPAVNYHQLFEETYRLTDDDRRDVAHFPDKFFVIDLERILAHLDLETVRNMLTAALELSDVIISRPSQAYWDEYATYLQF